MPDILNETQNHEETLTLVDTFFYCQKEHCRMRKSECLRYQNIAKHKVKHPYHGAVMSHRATDRINCRDCEQGKKIKEELT